MNSDLARRHGVTAMLAAAGLVATGIGGVAIAAASGKSTALHACADHKGNLSLVAHNGKCKSGSHKVSVGALGPRGVPGKNAPAIATSFNHTAVFDGTDVIATDRILISLTSAGDQGDPQGKVKLASAGTLAVRASLGMDESANNHEMACGVYVGTNVNALSQIGETADQRDTATVASSVLVTIQAESLEPAGSYQVEIRCNDSAYTTGPADWHYYKGDLDVTAYPS